jgi:hypothetical protein
MKCRKEAQMLTDAKLVDPWTQTITLLLMPEQSELRLTEQAPPPVVVSPTRSPTLDASRAKAKPFVRIIDRPTALTVTLDWRDATKCCYREQLWVAARARVSGSCAMSGEPILPGDDIFRPRPSRPVPRNVGAMILASAVEAEVPSRPAMDEPFSHPCIEHTIVLSVDDAFFVTSARF